MSDREAFEKWASELTYINLEHGRGDYFSLHTAYLFKGFKAGWQAAQAQAGKPIAAVTGWYDGRCVIEPLDRALAIPVGMALYSQPQAQAGNGEIVYAYRPRGLDYYSTCDKAKHLILSVDPDFEVAVFYTAPPAAVNQQLTLGDLNTIRQWHNAIKDAYVNYLEEQDATVFAKIEAAIAAAQSQEQK